MSLFIKQARELYNSTFSTANLKKYSNEDINIQLEGSARIDEYYKSVFILLSKAVLSGEYIFDPNYRKALDAFEADIAMEIGNIDTYFTQRFSDLSLGLKCILKHYVGFLINTKRKANFFPFSPITRPTAALVGRLVPPLPCGAPRPMILIMSCVLFSASNKQICIKYRFAFPFEF